MKMKVKESKAMRANRNKLLCVVIALFLALSGAAGGNRVPDCSYCGASPSDNKDISSIKSAHAVITDMPVCTTEVSGLRSNASVRQLSARFDGRGRKTGSSDNCQVSDNTFWQNHIRLFAGLKASLYDNKYDGEIITDFIHKSDGKKRI